MDYQFALTWLVVVLISLIILAGADIYRRYKLGEEAERQKERMQRSAERDREVMRQKAYDLCVTTTAMCDHFSARLVAGADRKELCALRDRTFERLFDGEQYLNGEQALDVWKALRRLDRDLRAIG